MLILWNTPDGIAVTHIADGVSADNEINKIQSKNPEFEFIKTCEVSALPENRNLRNGWYWCKKDNCIKINFDKARAFKIKQLKGRLKLKIDALTKEYISMQAADEDLTAIKSRIKNHREAVVRIDDLTLTMTEQELSECELQDFL